MSKPPSEARSGRVAALAAGFSRGLAQAVTGGIRPHAYPVKLSTAEALRSDWIKLGGDMREAVSRVRAHG